MKMTPERQAVQKAADLELAKRLRTCDREVLLQLISRLRLAADERPTRTLESFHRLHGDHLMTKATKMMNAAGEERELAWKALEKTSTARGRLELLAKIEEADAKYLRADRLWTRGLAEAFPKAEKAEPDIAAPSCGACGEPFDDDLKESVIVAGLCSVCGHAAGESTEAADGEGR
jgi:hypothetical protein